ncbi:MAG: hypothetical protein KDJ98_20070, partial [Rhodobacteraceae bacterium]|nr:hypothetical protein [Paracoccaceae bacterium]
VEAERLAAEQAARAAEEAPAEHPETPRRRVVVVRPMSPAPAAAPAADDDAVLQAALAAARETTPPPLPVEALAPVVEPATDAADTVRAAMAAFAATETAELGDEEDETPVIAAASAPIPPELADEDEDTEVAASPMPEAMDDEDEEEEDDEDDEEPLDDAALQSRVARALGETGLPAEEEAELLAELTAVEREAESLRRAARERRTILRDEGADAAADRLARAADSQFSDAGAQRRQSTISHLKAAVAATRAEEEASGPRSDAEDEQREIARYRADLERSVGRPSAVAAEGGDDSTPRRPARPAAQRTERPRNAQPPLVLVSEQRIDRPTDTEVVRPRRINTGALAVEELYDEDAPAPAAPRGRAFADFSGPMHLTTLAELVEAAAAYVTHVEGLEEFTRPQVMRHVASTGLPMTRSRENMLRSFGLLMRQGVLMRSRRGQFSLSPDSEFGAQARRFSTTA